MKLIIPCTLAILTKNNESTLPKALEFADVFEEVLICDGGSTDKTLEIAESHGAKVIYQAKEFQDTEGKLIDFSGVRNQMLLESKFDWQLHLDSDEELTKQFIHEISLIVNQTSSQTEKIFLVPRKYFYKGDLIEDSITYPNCQYRFFNRRHVTPFTKKIHERIRFKSSEKVGRLSSYMVVPIDMTPEEQWKKLVNYIDKESETYDRGTFSKRVRHFRVISKRIIALTIRLFTKRFFKSGKKLPITFDLNVIRYQCHMLKKLVF